MFESQVPLRRIGEKCAPDTSISQKLCRPQDIAVKVTSLVPGAAASQKAAYVVKCTVARQFKRKRQISSQPVKWSSTLTLPPTFIQRERDSGLCVIRPPTLDRPKAEFSGFAQGDGLVTPPDFVSRIGTLFPIAPCGRSSL